MKEEISKPLKIIFLVHFFLSIVFSLVFIIFWEQHYNLFGFPSDPIASRAFGAALAGFAASSLLAWRETQWIRVKIVVQVELAWLSVGIVVMILSLIFDNPSGILFLYLTIFIVFLGVFIWFYYQQEK
ncbi:MAG: hypothetical protein ACFFDX_14495 [Candidatus Odinarchaeota archaeon]